MISDHIKEAVKKQILKDLEDYFQEAEEHEDDEVQESIDVGGRTEDFYIYTQTVRLGMTWENMQRDKVND